MSDTQTDAAGVKPIGWRSRALITVVAPLIHLAVRLLQASLRVERVIGESHLQPLLTNGNAIIPCCWHQRLFFCDAYLLGQRAHGLNPGFLISPSRDGELTSRVVRRFGASVVRGSANRTGAQALRELYLTVTSGVSPISHPDGPHGPPYQAKHGSLMLAQITGAPLLPMAYSVDRYWQLGSWDRLLIPKPFARVTLVIGAPLQVSKKDDLAAAGTQLESSLNALTLEADKRAGSAPQPRPSLPQ